MPTLVQPASSTSPRHAAITRAIRPPRWLLLFLRRLGCQVAPDPRLCAPASRLVCLCRKEVFHVRETAKTVPHPSEGGLAGRRSVEERLVTAGFSSVFTTPIARGGGAPPGAGPGALSGGF